MTSNTAYDGRPAGGFTDYVTPIQPPETSDNPAPYVIPGFNSTECIHHDSHPGNAAPDLANLSSELFMIGGAVCGSIGGWKSGAEIKSETVSAAVSEEAETELLPAVRLVKDQLTECFGWLPLWKTPACKTMFELGGRYAPRVVPMLRGGLVGGITGTLSGYALGYVAGSLIDWCGDRLTAGYNLLVSAGRNCFPNQ